MSVKIIIPCIVCFLIGFLIPRSGTIKEVVVTKSVDKIVYRDYTKTDVLKELQLYDTTPMILKYDVRGILPEKTELDIKWKLHDREGMQSIDVPVYQQGNWKLYLGAGIGAVAAGSIFLILK